MLGFAFVDVFRTLRFDLDWKRSTPALEAEIVAWAEQRLASATLFIPTPATQLFATAHEDDGPRLAYLDHHGFTRLADAILHLERSLAVPVEVSPLPVGFRMRLVADEGEAAELASLHRAAFGTPHMTTERRLAMMRAAHYDPALDFVVVTEEGAHTAYGMGSISIEENALTGRSEARSDLFATHPPFAGVAWRVRCLSRSWGFCAPRAATPPS